MTTELAPAATARDRAVEGEITAITTRCGHRPRVAVATAEGSCWLLDETGTVLAGTETGVDVATGVALHPAREEVTVIGARGYAVWESGRDPVTHADGWSSAAAYNAKGDLAVAAGRKVRIHADTQTAPFVSAALPSTVTGVAWMPDGSRVAASAYCGVHLYDGQSPDPVHTYPYIGSHLAVAVNPDGRWVCSGNQDASVHIWRTADNDELEMAGYPHKVTVLAFDDAGRWFANNGAPELTVWDFAGKGPWGRKPRLFKGHTRVVDIAWRPGASQMLASVGAEGSVRIWNLTGMAAGRTRGATRVLPYDDALAVRWIDSERLVVARAGGRFSLVPWPPT